MVFSLATTNSLTKPVTTLTLWEPVQPDSEKRREREAADRRATASVVVVFIVKLLPLLGS
jgi:hypothetical protein